MASWCICIVLSLLSSVSSISAATIVVDQSNQGSFTTVQAAINSVPSGNIEWTIINIREGIYREQVIIPYDKPFIILQGTGIQTTIISWNGHGPIDRDATFNSEANNTIVRDISFVNSYNTPPKVNTNPMVRAVAARIKGDNSAFYRCGFFGLQDTLWDVEGRHYYERCTIEGAVDFIFGAGQSLFESCAISVAAGALNGPGFITAQRREKPNDTNGFVFKNCVIVGEGKVYLGRPWGKYARVLFYNTQMADIIVPQGWDAWTSVGQENLLTLSEYNSQGPGSNSSMRVGWAKKLSDEEANKLATVSFIK
ncbi:probable pectinesterase 29 [Salvia splendens]|uniref:probable pectinesterase 29 n=1 Tax=Salvia splendens TaxID=180675 RepID=UPI001C274A36|nr:probable pectinesterase 29 [Salvia splendens]